MSTILKRKLEIKNTLASSKSKNWKPSPPCMQVRHLSASSRNRSHPCSSLSVHYPRVKGVNTISSLSSKSKTPTSWICKLLGNMDFKLKSSKLPTTVLQPSLLVLIYLSMSFLGLICQAMSHLQGALTKQPKKKKNKQPTVVNIPWTSYYGHFYENDRSVTGKGRPRWRKKLARKHTPCNTGKINES